MNRLLEYLNAHDGSWGCAARYEEMVAERGDAIGDGKYPYLAGYYSSVLGEVVRMVGRDRLQRLAALHEELDSLERSNK